MATPHATLDQLTTWVQAEGLTLTIPDDAQRYIRQASLLVDQHLRHCHPYEPQDDIQQAAVTDATIIQAIYWIQNQITPMGESVQTSGKVVASAGLLSGSMSFAGVDDTMKARANAAERLCFEARLTLGLAGMNESTSVRAVG